jgi:hypothetical protein
MEPDIYIGFSPALHLQSSICTLSKQTIKEIVIYIELSNIHCFGKYYESIATIILKVYRISALNSITTGFLKISMLAMENRRLSCNIY